MAVEVGRQPEYLRVHLTPNSPFQAKMVPAGNGQYPSAPAFYFPVDEDSSLVWTSQLSADRKVASWDVPSGEVDALIAASPARKARLVLANVVQAEGRFEVHHD